MENAILFTVLQTCPWCGGGGGMGGGTWGLGVLWPVLLLFVLLLLVAIATGVAYLFRTATDDDESDRAMDLLRERYARGEISEEEFEERSAKLSSE